MTIRVPDDVVEFVRNAFASANLKSTMTLARQPAAHEEMLDFQVFAALDEIGPCIMPESGAVVEIDTHWLGGRRYWGGRWEIADIGVVVVLRRGGYLIWRKVALLQSKRLYAREVPVVELERADFEIGIGRLVDQPEQSAAPSKPTKFSFTPECVYGAMAAAAKQVESIKAYMKKQNMPVYYSFYNPPTMPYEGVIPRSTPLEMQNIPLGCRVLTAVDAHIALEKLPVGRTPRFSEMVRESPAPTDEFGVHGWRLESFVADEVLRCREGRLFDTPDHEDLRSLLYERSAPISSLIQISVNIPGPD